ncbi:hypothetical protein NUW54_g13132 [Trametes sanguinea]|uniref:Uncharacterized protein n=1 Tax=Trametes sanguinea TaxID=158606 RepID=A0ACC1MP34_9APHY|nr:hypothetical protein NUW54_g13132 [Trametes sanguinea]
MLATDASQRDRVAGARADIQRRVRQVPDGHVHCAPPTTPSPPPTVAVFTDSSSPSPTTRLHPSTDRLRRPAQL